MDNHKKTKLVSKDKLFFDNLGDKFISTEEKIFFEKMKYNVIVRMIAKQLSCIGEKSLCRIS